MRFGLLLPHFGEHASAAKIVDGARRAEALGFDSVWVRDHLLFTPHGEFERADHTFYEALTVLTAVGASTTTITLGTGALIPFRHPLHTALTVATMTQFFGPRVVLGIGAGNAEHEFASVGLAGVPRPELVGKHVRIMRRMWTEPEVSWADEVFRFTGASQLPRPAGGPVPFWFCGTTPRSVRLATDFCDGWLPGRIPLRTLRSRVALLTERAARAGRPRPAVGAIPTTSVAADRATALSRVDVPGLLDWANHARFWVKPPTGRFDSVADLAGMLVYGTADDVVQQCRELADAGVDHLVFDCRLTFDRWEEQMEILGAEVLPRILRYT